MDNFVDRWTSNPWFHLGAGVLGAQNIGSGLLLGQESALRQQQLGMKKAEQKRQIDAYNQMLSAARHIQMTNPQFANLPPEQAIKAYQDSVTPTASVLNTKFDASPEGQDTIKQAAAGLGLTVPQYMRIKSGVTDPTSPGQPKAPIKAENHPNWVNPENGENLSDYNLRNPDNLVSTTQEAYRQGFRPQSVEGRKQAAQIKQQGSSLGNYFNRLMDYYDDTKDMGVFDKTETQFKAIIGADEDIANKLRVLRDNHEALAVGLARLKEVGTMTDRDVDRNIARLPKAWPSASGFADNKNSAIMKMKLIEDDLSNYGIKVNWNATNPDEVFQEESKLSPEALEVLKELNIP